MTTNENTGSIPEAPEETAVLHNAHGGPDEHPTEQPTTVAGGVVGPLETAKEISEETKD